MLCKCGEPIERCCCEQDAYEKKIKELEAKLTKAEDILKDCDDTFDSLFLVEPTDQTEVENSRKRIKDYFNNKHIGE